MADADRDNHVRSLEREAEALRARLHKTITQIKDPHMMEDAKRDMKHRTADLKDQVLGYMRGQRDTALESGRSQTRDVSQSLQRNIINNPLPVLLIGAGLGWRLYKKPPITTALIGAGLYSLYKSWSHSTDQHMWNDPYAANRPGGYVPGGVAGLGFDEITDLSGMTERVQKTATNLTYGAQDMVAGVQDAMTQAADRVRDAVAKPAAAIGLSKKPMAEDERQTLRGQVGLLLGLASAGVCAGVLLRQSKMGRRWMNEARHGLDEGMDAVRIFTQSAPHSAEELRDRSIKAVNRASEQAQDMASDHPVLLSAVGLAVGVVLGSMIRQSDFGRDTLRPLAEDLRQRGRETFQDHVGQVGERAGRMVDKMVEVMGVDSHNRSTQMHQEPRVKA